jgi:RHS repeat-associated protein
MTQKLYPDTQKVIYYYDEEGYGYANGRLTRVIYPKGAESYTYDNRGRQKILTQTIAGLTRTKKLDYNGLDQVITQTYPDSEVVNYIYDNGGNIAKLSGAAPYIDNLEYYATGKPSQMLYGNAVLTDYDYYDSSGKIDPTSGTSCSFRLRQIKAINTKSGNELFNLTYQYDLIDNVKLKQDGNNADLSEQYDYDDLSRLISATSASYGQKTFRYDTLGNILEKDSRVYKYDSIHPYTVVNDGKYGYSYDANGNQTQRSDGRSLNWDYENRLITVSDGGTYYYDGDGQRIAKDENGINTYYFFNDYEEEYKAGLKSKTVKYYIANNQRVAENSSVDGVRYYIQDHLGSTSAVTDAAGNLVLRTNYAPYGEVATTQGNSGIKYTFTGKEQDKMGLYYFGVRYYDPEVGRFLTVDPKKDGLNWYAYCENNPINFVDLDGFYTSPWYLRSTVPGQISWDNALTAWENRRYGEAVAWTGMMLGEQIMFVWTLGKSQAALKSGSIRSSVISSTVTKQAAKTTVWNSIKATQPVYQGTAIPKSFEIAVGSQKMWVHPNATEHMFEYVTKNLTHSRNINSQQILTSFQHALKAAIQNGIKYGKMLKVDNWEFILSKPRGEGLLPVVKHAQYIP